MRSRVAGTMLIPAIKIAVLVYLGFGLYLYVAQRSVMYFTVAENPADDVAFELIDSAGETLKVWVINAGRPGAAVYFGGNAEDVYYNADDFRRWLPGHTVYLVNYRGYGGSSGSPTQARLFADALAVFDRLNQRHVAISVIGRSLGSAVATFLASERPVQRLVLVTPYDSAVAVARRLYPVYPVSLMLKDRYESVRYAPSVEAPVLVVVAEHDRVIPPVHSQALVDAFSPGQVRQRVIRNAGHNDLSAHAQYWQTVHDFLQPGSAAGGR